ncbi:MAG: iron-sulfur cluster carrier protein ApbC [Natronospirillum sp.]|uniref:iron-sulfur cluster carrier protein ApbC n=1 Tax=Natronospirillum sp. TaxID=2812955 RepID=UPI0025E4A06A|nr:iron-sulfur cluster carrier protein ApbC [Natronospirillum sp.]MCH8553215.1 iron-sulfur cluster carrier protein ApbC [Natronospirillum sp.]
MSQTVPDRAHIARCLRQVTDPHTGQPLDSPQLKSFQIEQDRLHVVLELGYPARLFGPGLATLVSQQLEVIHSGPIKVDVEWAVARQATAGQTAAMANVKNIIAVASGKGGVGKSTTAVNLALAMAREGARVGVLDADIYGPSQGMMLGIPSGTKPETREGKWFVPLQAHGVQAMSMAFITTDKTPMVWRGPMVSGALQQLLGQTQWDDLDYLVVDMPPGTGDIQLTFAQKVPATGSVIVTTPQDIALLDARKGIEMFRKVNIPVLGVVENMALHTCSQCGHQEAIFGHGGGEKLARDYDVDILASLPLDMQIREQADGGAPTVISDPESDIALQYQVLARRTMANIAALAADGPAIPTFSVTED